MNAESMQFGRTQIEPRNIATTRKKERASKARWLQPGAPFPHIHRILWFLSFSLAALVHSAVASYAAVTFNHDVAPVLYRNCTYCHRPGEAAPFSLLTYRDAEKKGKTIAKVTASRTMPPWKAEPASFAYRDDRRLTDQQVALIQDWYRAGMPEGDGHAPDPPKFASGWGLGEPDLIVEMPAAYQLPPD